MDDGRNGEMRLGSLVWAAAAVVAGCALLVALGAPPRMPAMNGAALLIGLACVAAMWACRRAGASARISDIALLIASAFIPLTALIGPQPDGVARWLVIGGLTIQPALIVVPLVIVGLAQRPSLIRCLSAVVAAVGLAMQPDAGCALMMVFGIAVLLREPESRSLGTWITFVAVAICLGVAIVRDVALPPVPFVEDVLPGAFRAGPLPALLACATILLMLAPAVTRRLRAPHLAFIAVWVAALAAALLGPYPTPVLGFGGSAVLGVMLSTGLLALGAGVAARRAA